MKIVLTNPASDLTDASFDAQVTANNAAITAAFENTLSRDGTAPNTMGAALDMNSQRILNLPRATSLLEPVRLQEVGDAPALAAAAAVSESNAATSASSAATSESNAATSATSASASAASAAATLALSLQSANNLSDLASVSAAKTNLALDEVNNTSDANKPLSTAQATAIALKADIVSPALTGTPTVPTATALTNNTQAASTAYADSAVSTLSGTVTTALALKAPLASPTFTGVPAAPTATVGTNTTQLATTAFVLANAAAAGVTSFNTRTGVVTPQADDYAALGGLELFNLGFTVSASAGALTISLTDATGGTPSATSPAVIPFRSATLTTGTTSVLKVTAATSVVVPSTSTLGTTSAFACRLWIIGWNDGGTFRLGVFNASNATTIFPLPEYGLGTSLQVVASGNSAGQHYTAGAAVTSKAFRILGFVDWTSSGVVTAGTWTTTNLNSIQVFGPGIKQPGDIVQSKYALIAGTTSTGSTAFIDSAITSTITPTSAANLIIMRVSALSNIGGAAEFGLSQARRDTTDIGMGTNWGNAASSNTTCSWLVYDKPNKTTSTIYLIRIKSNTGGTVALPASANSAAEELIEIMG